MYGIGNWEDIATHIGTRNGTACKDHYWRCYLQSSEDDEITSPRAALTKEVSVMDGAGGEKKDDATDGQSTDANTGAGKKQSDNKSSNVQSSASSSVENGKNKKKLPGSDISGYLPLRGDFEVEHDNDAELAIADMDFPLNDNPLERSLKLKIIEMYNSKLDERERRKRMVERYGLLEVQKNKQIDKRRPKAERDIHDRMRVFARFLRKKEYDTFVNNLILEMRLRERIEKLREYRQNGIQTLQEERFMIEAKRDQEAKVRKHRAATPYLFKKSSKTGGTHRNARYAKREDSAKDTGNGGVSSTTEKNQNEVTYEKLNIHGLPQVEKLSDKEKLLCATLRLEPKKYLSIKNAVVKECLKQGSLAKRKASQIIQMDVNKSGELYDFFVSTVNWKLTSASGGVRQEDYKKLVSKCHQLYNYFHGSSSSRVKFNFFN